MNRMLLFLLVVFISFSFNSCDSKKDKNDISVVLVSGIGSIDDKSFNQSAWEGILKYAKENNMPKENYIHTNPARTEDFVITLANFADEKRTLIIALAYYLKDAVDIVSSKYPNQKFLLFDSISKPNKNISSITFAANEGSFLVGICAALKADEMNLKKVGFLGGMNSKPIQEFEAGFKAGVKIINPNIKVFSFFADDFANPTKGQKIASKMYDKGINIIFNVAATTGNGLIKEAKKRASLGDDVWVVGVDKDQYKYGIYKEGKSVILTSMMKRLDIAVYDTLSSLKKGEFQAGVTLYSLKNNGVSLPKNNPNLKTQWLEIVEKYKNDIINEKIVVPNTVK